MTGGVGRVIIRPRKARKRMLTRREIKDGDHTKTTDQAKNIGLKRKNCSTGWQFRLHQISHFQVQLHNNAGWPRSRRHVSTASNGRAARRCLSQEYCGNSALELLSLRRCLVPLGGRRREVVSARGWHRTARDQCLSRTGDLKKAEVLGGGKSCRCSEAIQAEK